MITPPIPTRQRKMSSVCDCVCVFFAFGIGTLDSCSFDDGGL